MFSSRRARLSWSILAVSMQMMQLLELGNQLMIVKFLLLHHIKVGRLAAADGPDTPTGGLTFRCRPFIV